MDYTICVLSIVNVNLSISASTSEIYVISSASSLSPEGALVERDKEHGESGRKPLQLRRDERKKARKYHLGIFQRPAD